MAATILVKEAVWRACVLLEDCKPQFTRWTERELISWLGDAQLAIAKFLPTSAARIDAIKLKAGTRHSIELIAAAGEGKRPTFTITGYTGSVMNVSPRSMWKSGLSARALASASMRMPSLSSSSTSFTNLKLAS